MYQYPIVASAIFPSKNIRDSGFVDSNFFVWIQIWRLKKLPVQVPVPVPYRKV
jgi:hypothetical protein